MVSLPEQKLQRLEYLKQLLVEHRAYEEGGGVIRKPWRSVARPNQLPPDGDWFVWLLLAGRGFGKTRAAAEWVAEKARKFPGARIAIVANTIADARDTCIEGESGLLNCLSPHELRGGAIDTGWNRSLTEVRFANRSYVKGFSSERPWKLRGPQFHFAWGDEACFWADASKGTISDTTWSNLLIATRLPARPGWDDEYLTQIVVATTPRPVPLLRTSDPDPARRGIMQRDDAIITRGKTTENLDNLSESYKATVIAPLMGTRLGRQELEAEILDDRDDALWRRDWIEETRMPADPMPEFSRVVIAVDPAVSDGEGAAETGIIVAGADKRGHGYVIADETMRGSPDVVMRKIASLYYRYNADRVVAEVNNGGDYIGSVLRAVDANVPYRMVRATRGKALRAEPISALYEQRRIHHLGTFPYLEDQQCSWSPIDDVSPDRLDACVWAFTDLKDLVTASWMDAYGVMKCPSCSKPLFRQVDGVDRSHCPFCSAPLEE